MRPALPSDVAVPAQRGAPGRPRSFSARGRLRWPLRGARVRAPGRGHGLLEDGNLPARMRRPAIGRFLRARGTENGVRTRLPPRRPGNRSEAAERRADPALRLHATEEPGARAAVRSSVTPLPHIHEDPDACAALGLRHRAFFRVRGTGSARQPKPGTGRLRARAREPKRGLRSRPDRGPLPLRPKARSSAAPPIGKTRGLHNRCGTGSS